MAFVLRSASVTGECVVTRQAGAEAHVQARLPPHKRDGPGVRGFTFSAATDLQEDGLNYDNENEFCRSQGLWDVRVVKKTKMVRVVMARTRAGDHVVVKFQSAWTAPAHRGITPGSTEVETMCMAHVAALQTVVGCGPFYASIHKHSTFGTSGGQRMVAIESKRFGVTLHDWLSARECPARTDPGFPADAMAPWVYTAGAGRALATSRHDVDRAFFNEILRALIFQVWLGLAQGQRHIGLCHNDLHANNVVLDHTLVRGRKTFVTGWGTFQVNTGLPAAALIDFALASFDELDDEGRVLCRVNGFDANFPLGIYNGNSFFYDVWRISTNLVLVGLRELWYEVNIDIREHLWRLAQFPGQSSVLGGSSWSTPKLPQCMHWCPFLLQGVLPEDALADECFSRFRGRATTPTDHLWVEAPTKGRAEDHADSAFFRRAVLTPYGDPYAKTVFVEPLGPKECFANRLAPFAAQYWGRLRSVLCTLSEYDISAKARMLYYELETLEWAAHHAYKGNLFQHPLGAAPILDALVCILRGTFVWSARPNSEAFVAYHGAVRAALSRQDVRCISGALKPALPCHFLPHSRFRLLQESQLLSWETNVLEAMKASTYAGAV